MKINRRAFLTHSTMAGVLALAGGMPIAKKAGAHAHTHKKPAKKYDALIIGAGFAGLHAAMLLQEEGLDILVLEAAGRVGGRAYTLDFLPGTPEAGGYQIGGGYARMRHMAEALQVPLADIPPPQHAWLIALGEHKISLKNWQNSPHNPLHAHERALTPFSLAGPSLRQNSLIDITAWEEEASLAYDMPYDIYLKQQGASPAALRLIAQQFNAASLHDMSALSELRKAKLFALERTLGKTQHVQGGTSRLAESMAAKLGGAVVRLNQQVVSLTQDKHGIKAQTDKGETYQADFAIATLPFSVLRHIDISPRPPKAQNMLIQNMPYSAATSVFLIPKRAIWEEDGLGANMWTDGPLERIFAMQGGKQKEISTLWCFRNGPQARAFDALDKQAQRELVFAEMKRLRPASQGAFDIGHIHSWTQYPHMQGAWAYWQPGQMRASIAHFRKPHGRLHFAGEHLAQFHAGMEAAFESGERAAWEIIDTVS